MAETEAIYLVLAPQGITSSTGRHAQGDQLFASELDGAAARLERDGFVILTTGKGTPPKGLKREGVPDWNEIPAPGPRPTPQEAAEAAGPGATPESAVANHPDFSPVPLATVMAEAAPPTTASPDADAGAVVAMPAPAVIRFTSENPGRIEDVLTAEQQRDRPRQSVIAALREQAGATPTQKTAVHRPTPTKAPAKKAPAKRAATRKG